MKNIIVEAWYDESYKSQGFSAQRFYPNEELLRFLGRTFFSSVSYADRAKIKVLELGSGSCSNLWMIAKEGFDSYGIELSAEANLLGSQMLDRWGVTADLKQGSMTELPYESSSIDVVVDVFSTHCLIEKDFRVCLGEVKRVLRPNGYFFSYTPSTSSDAYKKPGLSNKIDDYTLNGISRDTAPFCGNLYPFHFIDKERYIKLLTDYGLKSEYIETTGRTYRHGEEYFEFITSVARNT